MIVCNQFPIFHLNSKVIVESQSKIKFIVGSIICLLLFITTLSLAYWQHNRTALKQQQQELVNNRANQPAVNAQELTMTAVDQLYWRQANFAGVYDATGQFLIDNQVINGKVGYHVISPLQLGDGNWLLVNRGWLVGAARRDQTQLPNLVNLTVTVAGTLVRDQAANFKLAGPQIEGKIWQNLNLARWSELTGNSVVSVVLLAQVNDSNLTPVNRQPDFRAARSRGYSVQLLLFAMVVLVGWLVVTFKMKSNNEK